MDATWHDFFSSAASLAALFSSMQSFAKVSLSLDPPELNTYRLVTHTGSDRFISRHRLFYIRARRVDMRMHPSQSKRARTKDMGKKYGTLHEFACHPCAGAMLIFSVSFQF